MTYVDVVNGKRVKMSLRFASPNSANWLRIVAISTAMVLGTVVTVPVVVDASSTGSISGTVSDATTNIPIAAVCVVAYSSANSNGTSATTANDGNYFITGLSPGSYTVIFLPNCSNSTAYPTQTTLSGIIVTAGLVTQNVNVRLIAGGSSTYGGSGNSSSTGSISVSVTDPSTGKAIGNVCVAEYAASQGAVGGGGLSQPTASDGTVVFGGLQPGTYTLYILPNCNQSTPYVEQTVLSDISVTAGSTTFVTVSPQLAVSLSGTVTDSATGAPLSGVCIVVINGSGFLVGTTASDGTYTVTGLTPGPYTAEANVSWYWAPNDTCTSLPNFAPLTKLGAGTAMSGVNVVNVDVGLTSFTGVPNSVTLSSAASTTVSQSSGAASAVVSIPAGALPIGTSVSLYPVTNSAPLLPQLPAGASYLASFVVAWRSPDGTSPTAAVPLIMTIKDPGIVAGDIIFMPTSVGLTREVTAATNGSVSLTFTTDPTLILSRPTIIGSSSISRRGTLNINAKRTLNGLARKLKVGASVTITGYSKNNVSLARNWAKAVGRYLLAKIRIHITVETVSNTKSNEVTIVATKN